jgi:3-dehydroquinate synthase
MVVSLANNFECISRKFMLTIQSQFHPYTVEVSDTMAGAIQSAIEGKKAFTVIDSNVYSLYAETIEKELADRPLVKVEATEEQKSFENLTPIFLELLHLGFRKDCTLLVIGGGVIQDIGCFIATVFFRGIKWTLIPTTLLAQCDSCIGSKSSINIQNFKNQIGTFYPPHQIYLVFSLLKTLPADEIRSGLGEIIKLHLLSGKTETERVKTNLDNFSHDFASIETLILDALAIKKVYIEQDELDKGVRNILNYGHTFGHAFESATAYKIPHGIGVTLGMLTATFFSERLGMVPEGYFQDLKEFLKPYYEPYHQELSLDDLPKVLGAVKLDKKNTGTVINCILTRGEGNMEKVSLDPEKQVNPLLQEFLKEITR